MTQTTRLTFLWVRQNLIETEATGELGCVTVGEVPETSAEKPFGEILTLMNTKIKEPFGQFIEQGLFPLLA